jgi:hypothetical protein
MARPKKKAEMALPASEKKELTKEEVYDVLRFAQSLYGGLYTPELVNARMRDITLSPIQATTDNITTALSNPKENERELMGYSEWLELNSMLYKRILLYFSGMLSFDFNYVCINADGEKAYQSPKYQSDLKIVRDFFDKFNHKENFKTALKQMLRNEAYFGILRDDGRDKYVLQELPKDFCKITGRSAEAGLLFDFNFQWFLNPTISIDMYPKIFARMYYDIFEKNGKPKYNPASQLDSRTGTFVLWHQTSPNDGFAAFKLFPEIAALVPLLAPIMPDIILQPAIRELQKNSYIQAASAILIGQVEFLKESKASVKDALTLDPVTLGKFLALLKSGIPEAIKVGAAPLANMEALQFEGNDKIYNSYLQTTAASSGVNSRLLYSYDRQNLIETKASLDIDINILRPVYSQFETMLDFWVNKRTTKYKFKFLLEGFENTLSRDDRFEKAMKLADSGIVLEQKFASAMSMSPFDFRRMLEEGRANGFVKNLTPILKSNQMPSSSGGRPKMEDDDLGDAGGETRGNGTDDERVE